MMLIYSRYVYIYVYKLLSNPIYTYHICIMNTYLMSYVLIVLADIYSWFIYMIIPSFFKNHSYTHEKL